MSTAEFFEMVTEFPLLRLTECFGNESEVRVRHIMKVTPCWDHGHSRSAFQSAQGRGRGEGGRTSICVQIA